MTDPDAGLVRAAQDGDRAALDQLLRAHQPGVYALCRRIVGNETDALDATQDALIAIVRGLDRFDGRSKVSTWVYRIATNSCLDEIRRRRRRPTPGLPEGDRTGDHQVARFDEQVAARIDIDSALQTIAPEFRAAVVLRDLCELDYAEIAEVLAVPPGTVRSRIARGRSALAAELSGNQPPTTRRQIRRS